ncbi:hypothetical protein HanRHA438_Chr10g0464341 [Helianthus annuus]|nr:hypothetical protein HanRHA438_Chr10g0464341 [Helianthus annuus]
MLSLTQRYSDCRVAIPNHRLLRFRYFYSASRFHTSQRHSGCRVAIPNHRLHRPVLLSFSF